ncbi:MAG: Cypemycin methyltransferase [candidate division WS6 bacterium OLB20]|uniref:Cypemycin methyltransferase n=1 Tax=candidate division WS6 bacterium OLB20 TaxID=1617426 RepID=A0A136LVX0_9BACT|nr:MAG: Cypemycin methyltransferase [candidate division WS6 bacterium OLB20]
MDRYTAWEQHYINHGRFHLDPHPMLTSVVNVFKAHDVKTVIDLGCGSGRHLVPLAEEGFDVQGIDFSPSAVDLAQKWLMEKNLPGRASVADIHEEVKAFGDASFDAAIAVDSLHYQTSGEFIDTLKEINRMLKTGGLLFLVVPSKISDEAAPEHTFRFNEPALRHALEGTFKVLEWRLDPEKHFAVIAQEIAA